MSEKSQDRIVDENDVHFHPDSNKEPPVETTYGYSIRAKTIYADHNDPTSDARNMLEDRKRRGN